MATISRPTVRGARLLALAFCVLVAAAAGFAFAPRPAPAFALTRAVPTRLAINALATIGQRVVAVGEQGQAFFSDDSGASWHDARVDAPHRATLNDVHFSADARTGIAVGHGGLILRSVDRGASWHEVTAAAQGGDPLLAVRAATAQQWLA